LNLVLVLTPLRADAYVGKEKIENYSQCKDNHQMNVSPVFMGHDEVFHMANRGLDVEVRLASLRHRVRMVRLAD